MYCVSTRVSTVCVYGMSTRVPLRVPYLGGEQPLQPRLPRASVRQPRLRTPPPWGTHEYSEYSRVPYWDRQTAEYSRVL